MYPIYRREGLTLSMKKREGLTLLIKKREGFTLIELFLTMGLLTVLLGAVTYTFVIGLRIGDVGMLAGGVRKEASYSLQIISEELRQATAVTAAGLHTLTFQADLDGNGVVDTITYSWPDPDTAENNLVRKQGTTPKTILAHGVQNASFQYYDSTGAALGPPFPVTASAVRIVGLTLQVAEEGESVKYETKIRPRGI